MSIIEDIKKEIEAAEEKLAKAKERMAKLEKEAGKVELWKPTTDSAYLTLDGSGDLVLHNWDGAPIDYERLFNGNVFRNEKTCDYFAENRTARNRLELLAFEVEGGIYEFTTAKDNWIISNNHIRNYYEVCCWNTHQLNTVYFSSRENATKVLNSLTDREKELLWGEI